MHVCLEVRLWPQRLPGNFDLVKDKKKSVLLRVSFHFENSYPLAFIAAKLSLGLKLTDVKNQATKFTTACFGN